MLVLICYDRWRFPLAVPEEHWENIGSIRFAVFYFHSCIELKGKPYQVYRVVVQSPEGNERLLDEATFGEAAMHVLGDPRLQAVLGNPDATGYTAIEAACE